MRHAMRLFVLVAVPGLVFGSLLPPGLADWCVPAHNDSMLNLVDTPPVCPGSTTILLPLLVILGGLVVAVELARVMRASR